MIKVFENEFRNVKKHPIFLGDNRRILRVYCNENQVYPEMDNPYIVKIRGNRTIHHTHSHDGRLADALFCAGAANRNSNNQIAKQIYPDNDSDIYDYYFSSDPVSFDIAVSFSAVLKSNFPFEIGDDGDFKTPDFQHDGGHLGLAPLYASSGPQSIPPVISDYISNGYWGDNVRIPLGLFSFSKMCGPLCGLPAIACNKYVSIPYPEGRESRITDFSDEPKDTFVDADILLSVEMSTPTACPSILSDSMWGGGGFGYSEINGKITTPKREYPEIAANNGTHRIKSIANKTTPYARYEGTFLYRDTFPQYRPSWASYGYSNLENHILFGNNFIACTLGGSVVNKKVSGMMTQKAYLTTLDLTGIAHDTSLSVEFPDWGKVYNYVDYLSATANGRREGSFTGIPLSQVPIQDFLYSGRYDDAPDVHKEPQISEL